MPELCPNGISSRALDFCFSHADPNTANRDALIFGTTGDSVCVRAGMKRVKTTVESCLVLISDLLRAGVFGASCGTPYNCIWHGSSGTQELRVDFWLEGNPLAALLRLRYTSSGFGGIPILLDIRIDAIPCHFGGARRVFLCPGAAHNQCGRQATKLDLVAGRWVCRACGDLTYEARQQHDRRLDALVRSPERLVEALES
jgi:hypothetical protein